MAESPQPSKPVVWVTRVGNCRKVAQFDSLGIQKLPMHFLSMRGVASHRAAEAAVDGGEPDWKSADSLGLGGEKVDGLMLEAIVEAARANFAKVLKWSETTRLLDDGLVEIEKPYRADFGGFVLSGKPDIHTEKVVVDVKSGKKKVWPEHVYQMTAYRELLGRATGRTYRCFLVFLGDGGDAQEVEILGSQMDDALPEFVKDAEQAAADKKWKSGDPELPADVTFKCGFCRYRHACRGF